LLKKKLLIVKVYDLDEEGVPEGADENWRRMKTNYWLEKAVNYFSKGKSTIICGVIVPEEVKNCPNYSNLLNVNYGFIRIDETEIRRRLNLRDWSSEQVEGNVIWAQHLERYVKAEKNHLIVDGVKNSPTELAEKFTEWIKKEIESF